jgi:hypothetical protein
MRLMRIVGGALAFTLYWLPHPCGAAPPTFTKDVAPILFAHCVRCHRGGQIASAVPFVSYESTRPWAKSIEEKVLAREMPPWPADPKASVKFRNDARLRQQDIDTLVAWVNDGSLKGNDSDLPVTPQFDVGWQHPEGRAPDLVIALPGEFQAPAQGEIRYVRYLAKVPVSGDRWVAASQTRPSNPALVHHMAITEVALDNGVTPADLGAISSLAKQLGIPSRIAAQPAVTALGNPALFDMLGVYTPGTTFESYGEYDAKLLRGGGNLYLNFNIHYQPTGKPEKDQSMIGLWFRSTPPKHQLFRVPASGETIVADGAELLTDAHGAKAEGTRVVIPPIPPFAENFEVAGITGFPEPVTIYQFQPHAHLRGKDFKYVAVFPDGREQTVLSVPKYSFSWQLAYELETPLALPAGSKLVVTAHYDNSRNNKYNPAPEKNVYFRDENQSWDEMFTPFIQYTLDNQDLTSGAGQLQNSSKQNIVAVVEVGGCLEQGAAGRWLLTSAGRPTISKSQSASSSSLRAAAAQDSGAGLYQLLGTGVFRPARQEKKKVIVKGLLIESTKESLLNVTSLEAVGPTCGNAHSDSR